VNDPGALATLGVMEQDEIKTLAGDLWHPSLPDQVQIRLNKAALEHDHVLILGPTFPHESSILGRREVSLPRHLGRRDDRRHALARRACRRLGTIGVKTRGTIK